MAGEFDTRACPLCGLETARAVRGLVLCAACGAVEPIPPEPERAARRGLSVSRRGLVVRATLVAAAVICVILSGVAAAFRAYGAVNYRYLGALAILLTALGVATVGALAWAAGDGTRDGTPGDGL